jgi:hypothetical protein
VPIQGVIPSVAPRSYAAFEDPFHITASVKNGSDLQWFRPRPIDDQVRVDRKESHIFVGQILPTVTGTRGSSKKSYFFADGGFNAVRNCEAGLYFDVTPDLDEIERSLRRKNKAHAHLGSAFQIRQVSTQLIFRDSFAAVELLDAGRTGRLKLFLDSGLKGRIVDFDIHVLSLQKGIGLSFHRI